MSELVDTHCHIQSIGLSQGEHTTSEAWSKAPDLTADMVVQAAVDSGVTKMICVGCDLADSQLAIDFVQSRPNCWASIGIHPHEAQHYAGHAGALTQFSDLVTQPKVVAIGECGFDFYYDHSPKEAQAKVFKFQIELALKHDLPMVFHVREAFDDFWQVLDQYSGVRGVVHSFTDNADNLAKAIERGLYIGVNGIASFAKDPAQLEVYRTIPLSNLVLETDAPFLTPTPYRGTINEPKRVVNIADFVADLRGEDREKLSAVTTSNARDLFGI